MSRLVCLAILLGLAYSFPASAQLRDQGKNVSKQILDTSGYHPALLKYGMLGSFCFAQSMTGLTEAYHFGQGDTHLISEKNYHLFDTARRVGWLGAGWMAHANMRDADLKWYQTGARMLGSALISRNCFEWSYKYARYGNPFDYSKEHNEHALVVLSFSGGQLVDAYIGTGKTSGPLVDLGFLVAGILLLK